MPKTRDAFALKDFDEKRILQRPYFKDFKFDAGLTDEEILNSMHVRVDDSIAEIEFKTMKLTVLSLRLSVYCSRVLYHAGRISRYSDRKDNQSAEFERREFLTARAMIVYYYLVRFFNSVESMRYNSASYLTSACKTTFAKRLKEARLKNNLSRRDLADLLHYTENGYGKIESGSNEPKLTALVRLSRRLKVSTDWLLGLE